MTTSPDSTRPPSDAAQVLRALAAMTPPHVDAVVEDRHVVAMVAERAASPAAKTRAPARDRARGRSWRGVLAVSSLRGAGVALAAVVSVSGLAYAADDSGFSLPMPVQDVARVIAAPVRTVVHAAEPIRRHHRNRGHAGTSTTSVATGAHRTGTTVSTRHQRGTGTTSTPITGVHGEQTTTTENSTTTSSEPATTATTFTAPPTIAPQGTTSTQAPATTGSTTTGSTTTPATTIPAHRHTTAAQRAKARARAARALAATKRRTARIRKRAAAAARAERRKAAAARHAAAVARRKAAAAAAAAKRRRQAAAGNVTSTTSTTSSPAPTSSTKRGPCSIAVTGSAAASRACRAARSTGSGTETAAAPAD